MSSTKRISAICALLAVNVPALSLPGRNDEWVVKGEIKLSQLRPSRIKAKRAERREAELARQEAEAVLEEIQPQLASLLEQLAPGIRADRYGVIVGDDTSGRVPALILREAINRYRTSKGLPKLPVVFVPGRGGRNSWSSGPYHHRMEQSGSRIAEAAAGKAVLLVTDYIATGETLIFFLDSFHRMGLPVHCAALSSSPYEHERSPSLVRTLANTDAIFVGSVRPRLDIDGNHGVSGVRKELFIRSGEGVVREPGSRHMAYAARMHASAMARNLAAGLMV